MQTGKDSQAALPGESGGWGVGVISRVQLLAAAHDRNQERQ